MSSILVLGASYGSLMATKLAMAGHDAQLVCSAATARLINGAGTLVRFPGAGGAPGFEVRSRQLPGTITAAAPDDTQPAGFDLVVLAMQESQYGELSVQRLMQRIAVARVPCLAIMNMPPPPFLARIERIDADALRDCYCTLEPWKLFDPALVTLASPDPQAFRPAGEDKNVLVVGLPTNFKAAPFVHPRANALLRRLAQDIENVRFVEDGLPQAVPVKLKVHESLFVPLAKWPMLVTGNYRCIRPDGMVSIEKAVHGDLDRSRRIYGWAVNVCLSLGAQPPDLVSFDKYALAASSLRKPSSAARALHAGAEAIERVDKLVARIAQQLQLPNDECSAIVDLVDRRLAANRTAQAMAEA